MEPMSSQAPANSPGFSPVSRRQVFRGLGAASVALAGAPAVVHAATAQPKNIIWMVSDGMSTGVVPMAEAFSRIARQRGTVWTELLRRKDVVQGMFDMASLNSMVTDSSSASSSWSSGSRIFNRALNTLPDGTKLTPIGHLARDKKKRIGLVTTATITHATPAGFAAISRDRDDEEGIAQQYRGVVDVLMGGGRKFFDASSRKDKRDLAGAYREDGYKVSYTRAEMKAEAGARLLGLYDSGHITYMIDRMGDKKLTERIPTLAEMARVALDTLNGSANGFLLQIEGARIDHAAHANDSAGLLWEQLAFDDTIRLVLSFVEKNPNTLVVVTSDHGNSNPGLVGMGTEYEKSNQCFELLMKARCSYTVLGRLLGGSAEYKGLSIESGANKAQPAGFVTQVMKDEMGFEMTPEEATILRLAVGRGRRLAVFQQRDNLPGILGEVIGNHTGIGWTGTTHTSDYAPVLAIGPGADQFAGLMRNTDAFVKLTRMMDIDFKNPSMDERKAKKFSEAAMLPPRVRVDWA